MAEGNNNNNRQLPTVKTDVHVLSLDIGTTSVRAQIFDHDANIQAYAAKKIQLLYPRPGWVEMDEEVLWQQVQDVIKEAIQGAGITADQVTCMGITTQRNTFITWDKETGRTFHRFITWQDLRACDYVKSWNESYTMKGLNHGSKLLHIFTRKKRFLAASVLRFKSQQITLRLLYEMHNNAELKKRMSERQVMFGNIDTWLLWKLTRGQVFATDYSCASSTGIYDPFQMEWSTIVSSLVSIPLHIFPPIRDTSGSFGSCSPEIFGAAIPITAVVADQQAALFGQCCFEVGDVKCTMGTGAFIDCNTGDKPHASVAGLYPLIGWKIGRELVFVAEGHVTDMGFCIEWAKNLGFFSEFSELEDMLKSVPDSGGICFVPAFSGLQAPINDDKACASLIGLSPEATKARIMRAVMESLAFRVKLLYDTVLMETKKPLSKVVRCDGGVSQNTFLMQMLSDLIGRRLDKPSVTDMTCLGSAFLAGLGAGVWKDKEELKRIRRTEVTFEPKRTPDDYKTVFSDWERAIKRSTQWHRHVKS